MTTTPTTETTFAELRNELRKEKENLCRIEAQLHIETALFEHLLATYSLLLHNN